MRMTLPENRCFAYRVGGIALHNNRVLLHRADFDLFWVLPGGGCEFFEESAAALKREIKEELSAETEIGGLKWVVENFFTYEGKSVHEIGMYYEFAFTGASEKLYALREFEGEEIHLVTKKPFKLYFKWFPLDEISRIAIKPSFLCERLLALPSLTERIVHTDLRPSSDIFAPNTEIPSIC